MKSGGGDFSAEAYQQLRDAYGKEQQRQVDDEVAGTKLMGQEYGLETLPVDSPWRDKVENWQYPTGKSQYLDEHQSPEEILQIMRDAAQERVEAKKAEEDPDGVDDMSDEEFDKYLDKVLSDATSEEEEETDESDEEDEESESDSDDSEETETEDEDESEEDAEDEEVGEEEDSGADAEDIAAEIAALRAEIESMQFTTDTPETDDESD